MLYFPKYPWLTSRMAEGGGGGGYLDCFGVCAEIKKKSWGLCLGTTKSQVIDSIANKNAQNYFSVNVNCLLRNHLQKIHPFICRNRREIGKCCEEILQRINQVCFKKLKFFWTESRIIRQLLMNLDSVSYEKLYRSRILRDFLFISYHT